jgi:hypothetical protein
MFKRSIAGLAVAGAALAAGFGTGAATPQVAQAASCQWQIPADMRITQSDGWRLHNLSSKRAGFKWYMLATNPEGPHALDGTLKLTRFDRTGSRPQVRFTVSWTNGHAGVYSGTIDSDGFVTGKTYDRFDTRNKARFHFDEAVDCA